MNITDEGFHVRVGVYLPVVLKELVTSLERPDGHVQMV